MGQHVVKPLRNIGIIAHIDAGKTTLTERILFYCGFTHRMGEVDQGTTVTDFDPEEQERGITINSACVSFTWNYVAINLIDTPGHVDFTAEVERSLRVLDGAVVVFSAREGVEAQSETVWRQADRYHVPRITFINKMDREGADYYRTVEEIRERLETLKPVPVQIPVGCGPPHFPDAFRGVIDLIEMQMLTFAAAARGANVVRSPIPPELLEDAELYRGQLLETLFDYSNELAELVLAESPVPSDLIRAVLRTATLHRMIVPVFCGSALDHIGVQPLLDGVVDYLPSPEEIPAIEGKDLDPKHKDRVLARAPRAEEPFCGLVFKIQADKHGDLHFVRIYSGMLNANTRVLNSGKDKKENVSQLWRIQADRREQIESAGPGEIVGVIGLRSSITGDTLCDAKNPILLESIEFPETVISMAVEPESSADRKKLADALEMLRRQDPTFRAVTNEETGQNLIRGMGELHLEIIKHKLERDFKLKIKVHKPRVSYRETIARAVEIEGECRRQIAGTQHTGTVRVRMEPFEGGATPTVVLDKSGSEIPETLKLVILEELSTLGLGGGLYGNPLMKVRITLLGGKIHPTESTPVAMRIAAADAFEKGLREADVMILEPIMKLEISTPDEHVGDFVSDLQQRRATISHTFPRGRMTVIEATAPLANLFGYSSAMRSLSQGRGTCSMEPSAYGPAPNEVLESFR